ncbi:MAG: 50S ribosomal protein L15 [Planctomycetes bacterium]|nr:50S ribosomal protein L15 [Planctomycetota bacterium]
MNIGDITRLAGAEKSRKRLGRGRGTGQGKTAGRGHKGCGARTGWKQRGLQEGGQMPTFRRLPKRGFSNAEFTRRYIVVNVGDLETRFESGAHVTPQALLEAGLVRHSGEPVKILGNGALTKKLTVDAARFSESAAAKIKAAGGEARVVAVAAASAE